MSTIRTEKPLVATESKDLPLYSIGSAARMLGISVHTLRMYEREGLVLAYKTETNQRRYSEADMDRLRCIRHAITEEKLGIAGIQHLQAMIPCWEIVECQEEKRESCPAFRNHTKGCWTFEHSATSCASRDCRDCLVYRVSTDCKAIKDFIIHASSK
jgi:MerR family transcriptional regulator/heat shock protein HspR